MSGDTVTPYVDGDIFFDTDANMVGEIVQIEAGEAITAGNVVYIHLTSSLLYVSDTGTANDIRASGISLESKSSGQDVYILKKGVYNTSGLTANEDYYLGAAGAISTTRSGVRIGHALSTTQLWVDIIQDDRDTIGTIKSYDKSRTGIPSNNVTAFWVECNGQTLSDAESPLNGQTIPDINGSSGTGRFLRGQTASGGTGGSETHQHSLQTGTFQDNGDGGTTRTVLTSTSTGATSTLPSYYGAVFLYKIK